jgi:hypothetical protein
MAKDNYDYATGSKSSTRDGDVSLPSKDTPTRPVPFPKNIKGDVDGYRGDGSERDAKTLRDALNQPEGPQTITKRSS